MPVSDPIADMLTRIRNANLVYKSEVLIPASKIKKEIAKILDEEGYISSWEVVKGDLEDTILLKMKYGPDRKRVITGLKRISKPGLRVYARKDALPRVLGGLGTAIISTSKGILTSQQAKKMDVGGEVICYLW